MAQNEQLRKHLKTTLMHRLRWLYQKMRLGHCGAGVHFEKNSHLMRYPRNISIDDNAVIKEGAKICACNNIARISIGQNTTVGYHTFMFASEEISIGHDCLIAPFVYIVDSDHGISRDIKINLQPNQTAKVTIGSDVWIGTGAKILKGVNIGDGSVISAGAVVTTDVEPYTVVGGIPAKKISERK